MKYSRQDNIFYISILLLVLLLFSSVFVLSFYHIPNMWSFSQAHLNYNEGFVRRGLFGTVMIGIEAIFKIQTKYFFSIFFILLNILNIVLFFKLIKKFVHNKIVFVFLALNPALLLFSFYDLGGYSRFDSISVSLIIIHALIAYKVYDKNLDINGYQRYLFIFILPIIAMSFFIHEIQIFSILFHIILSINVFKFKKQKSYILAAYLLLSFICFLSLLNGSLDQSSAKKLISELSKYKVWEEAIMITASTSWSMQDTINSYLHVFSYNALSPYNLRLHLFFYAISILPLIFLFLFLKNNNYYVVNNFEIKHLLIIIIPLLAGWIIGDLGRWINIAAFATICFASSLPLRKKISSLNFKKKKLRINIC